MVKKKYPINPYIERWVAAKFGQEVDSGSTFALVKDSAKALQEKIRQKILKISSSLKSTNVNMALATMIKTSRLDSFAGNPEAITNNLRNLIQSIRVNKSYGNIWGDFDAVTLINFLYVDALTHPNNPIAKNLAPILMGAVPLICEARNEMRSEVNLGPITTSSFGKTYISKKGNRYVKRRSTKTGKLYRKYIK